MKPQVKKILTFGLWTVLVLSLLVTLSFVESEQKQLRCKSLEISIIPEADRYFVTREMVVKMLTDGRDERVLVGEPVAAFNVGQLEENLEMNPYVSEAEVFIDIEGKLRVDVEQRDPVIRIMHTDGSGFYIDNKGIKMPLSDSFTAHVPIATGNIFEKFHAGEDSLYSKVGHDLYTLGVYIQQNKFWKAMVEQVVVNEKSELIIIPTIADHKVILGDATNLEEKLTNLRIFYKKGLNKVGWNKYKVINLKYTGQIVCEKY
jgi:cell division protein FtsQ